MKLTTTNLSEQEVTAYIATSNYQEFLASFSLSKCLRTLDLLVGTTYGVADSDIIKPILHSKVAALLSPVATKQEDYIITPHTCTDAFIASYLFLHKAAIDTANTGLLEEELAQYAILSRVLGLPVFEPTIHNKRNINHGYY